MNTIDLDRLLDQLFSHLKPNDRGEIAIVRARLADRLNETPGPPSARRMAAGEIVALLDHALEETQMEKLEAEIAGSPDMVFELTDALDFLNDIETRLEAAPDDLEPARLPAGTFAEAIHNLFRHGKMLSADQQRKLFTDPVLRAEFASIKREYAQAPAKAAATGGTTASRILELPSLAAAASDQALRDRAFPGGSVRITKSSLGDMLVQFSLEEEGGPYPRALLLEGENGAFGWSDLPPPDPAGKIMVIKDMAKTEHADFVRLLQDPRSRGTFLK